MDVCLQGVPREPTDVHALSIAKRASCSIDSPHYACIDFYTPHLGTNFTHCILVCAIYSVSIGERGKTYGNKIMRGSGVFRSAWYRSKGSEVHIVLCESSVFSVRHGFSKYTHLFLAAIFLLLCTYFLERCLIFSRDVFSSSIRERKWTRAFASIYYRRQIYEMLLSHVSAFFARAERDCVVGSGPPVHTVVIIFIFLTPVHLTHN